MNLVLVALVTIHFKPFKIMGWCFDFLTGILWATRHRGEGMPRCKMSHDATATRLDFGAPRVEWWGLLLLLLSTLGIVVMMV